MVFQQNAKHNPVTFANLDSKCNFISFRTIIFKTLKTLITWLSENDNPFIVASPENGY